MQFHSACGGWGKPVRREIRLPFDSPFYSNVLGHVRIQPRGLAGQPTTIPEGFPILQSVRGAIQFAGRHRVGHEAVCSTSITRNGHRFSLLVDPEWQPEQHFEPRQLHYILGTIPLGY